MDEKVHKHKRKKSRINIEDIYGISFNFHFGMEVFVIGCIYGKLYLDKDIWLFGTELNISLIFALAMFT